MEIGKNLCWVNEGGLRVVRAERSGPRGVDGWVGVSGHALSVVEAEGVSAEGGVCVLVFEGLRRGALLLFPVLVVFLSVRGGIRGDQGVVV
jgi:hypothetical protein